MVYQRREYPQWSWSYSRQQIFEECRRKYFLNYYAAHNGWEDSASESAKLAYRLKKLLNIYTALGLAVHSAAEMLCREAIDKRESVSPAGIEAHVRRLMRAIYCSSRDQYDRFLQNPNQHYMLQEFYYQGELSESLAERINERIACCTANLAESRTLHELLARKAQLLACEQFDTFLVGDTEVFAVPDLLCAFDDGSSLLVDWKTGRSDPANRGQVLLYALYAARKHALDVSRLNARVEYLEEGICEEYQFSTDDLAEAERQVERSVEEMRQYLVEPVLNKPKPESEFPATAERGRCLRCNFRQLCRHILDGRDGENCEWTFTGVS